MSRVVLLSCKKVNQLFANIYSNLLTTPQTWVTSIFMFSFFITLGHQKYIKLHTLPAKWVIDRYFAVNILFGKEPSKEHIIAHIFIIIMFFKLCKWLLYYKSKGALSTSKYIFYRYYFYLYQPDFKQQV